MNNNFNNQDCDFNHQHFKTIFFLGATGPTGPTGDIGPTS